MANDERYPLLRLKPPQTFPRKKRQPRFPSPPPRNVQTHAAVLRAGIRSTLDHLRKAEATTPGLATDVPYVRLQPIARTILTDDDVRGLGLIPVMHRADSVIAAYGQDRQLSKFDTKIASFAGGHAKHTVLLKLDAVGPWSRADRTSPRLQAVEIDPDKAYVVDLLLLPIDGASEASNATSAIQAYVRQVEGEVLDRMRSKMMSALRVRMRGQALDELLEYRDDVAMVDLPASARVTVPQLLSVELDQVTIVDPRDSGSTICVIDSGILEGHPLLAAAVRTDRSKSYPATLGSPIPTDFSQGASHGTWVAGIAAFGDVGKCVAEKRFEADALLINARILDDKAELDPDRMPFVRSIVDEHRATCRIFNFSIGLETGLDAPGGVSSPYAADIDALVREHDVLFAISSGNRPVHTATSPADLGTYPDYLLRDDCRVLAPGESLNALTVGGITPDTDLFAAHPSVASVAPRRSPSPFSRSGGLKNVVKPDLVEVAGNVAFDSSINRWVSNNAGIRIPTTGTGIARGALIGFVDGTSFSTPKVSSVAARILEKHPEASANLLRALLVQSARLPEGATGFSKEVAMRLCGFGVPEFDRAVYCSANRATLFHSGTVGIDDVQLFEIPVPADLAKSKGTKRLIVTVAYDPPVSALDQMRPRGIVLTWKVARGDIDEAKVVDKVAEAAEEESSGEVGEAKSAKDKKPVFMTGKLPHRLQQRGTIQKDIFEWKRGSYGETYRLALVAKATRPVHAAERQRFAVVVTIEHDDPTVAVYTSIRARLAAGRARVRVPGAG
jgi:subtilisin family serine protease